MATISHVIDDDDGGDDDDDDDDDDNNNNDDDDDCDDGALTTCLFFDRRRRPCGRLRLRLRPAVGHRQAVSERHKKIDCDDVYSGGDPGRQPSQR
jgi:hypothetical protein